MNEKSYKDITIRDICIAIPISRNTFYYHFEGKKELLIWTCIRNHKKYCQPFYIIRDKYPKKIDKEIYLKYAVSGIAAVLTYWVEQNYRTPVEKISEDLFVMLTKPLTEVRDYYVY